MQKCVDVVITWVRGEESQYIEKKKKFLRGAEKHGLSRSGKSNRRWENNNEILLCLGSIERNAPWVRKIWIVTDDQQPPLEGLSDELKHRISIVDHREIFRGFEEFLPTFNSLSIETVLWRIEGLADRFVYFNDDFFLTKPMQPEGFFKGDKPIVRGKWSDVNGEKLSMYRRNQLNAAVMMGYSADHFFANAHVANVFYKPILEAYYAEHPEVMKENLSHRFREYTQYSSIGLMTHLGIRDDTVILKTKKDWQNVTVGVCNSGDPELIERKLRRLDEPKIRFGCINDLAQAAETYPDTLRLLRQAIGLAPASP